MMSPRWTLSKLVEHAIGQDPVAGYHRRVHGAGGDLEGLGHGGLDDRGQDDGQHQGHQTRPAGRSGRAERALTRSPPGGPRESKAMVKGPSLVRVTCINAPKRPAAVRTPSASRARRKRSTRVSATAGSAASVKEGRLPFRVSAYRVNWLTTSASPATSSSDRLIFPASSSKMRRFAVLGRQAVRVSLASPWPTPSSITSPGPMDPDRLAVDGDLGVGRPVGARPASDHHSLPAPVGQAALRTYPHQLVDQVVSGVQQHLQVVAGQRHQPAVGGALAEHERRRAPGRQSVAWNATSFRRPSPRRRSLRSAITSGLTFPGMADAGVPGRSL